MLAAAESLLVLALILVNGFLSMSEMAVVAARKPRLHQLEDDGNTGATVALALAEEPGPFLSTVQIGITLIGILIGAFGGAAISDALAAWLGMLAPLQPFANTIAVLLVVIALTYVTLVIGELVPKQIALRDAAHVAARIAPLMSVLARIAAPLVAVLSLSSGAVLRVLGLGVVDDQAVTEEDVRTMLEQGAELGVFEPMEEEIVGKLFRLADQRIGALITHRSDIVWIDASAEPGAVRQQVIASGRSRLPVATGSLDNVTGIVLAKDLLAQCLLGSPLDLDAILQPALFVPENMPALDVVERFKERHAKIAMVIDEYGGIEGLVSVDDIMGALVGEIPEPEQPDEPSAIRRADGTWLVDGRLLLDELVGTIGLPESSATVEPYRTAGGLVMASLGRLPIAGDRFLWQGYWIEVLDMDGRRVDKILLSAAEPDAPHAEPE